MAFGFPGYIEVLLIATGLSLASVLISKYLGNQKGVKNLKAEMKALNANIKKAQKAGDTKEMNRLSGHLMKLSSKQFQLNMKPMITQGRKRITNVEIAIGRYPMISRVVMPRSPFDILMNKSVAGNRSARPN